MFELDNNIVLLTMLAGFSVAVLLYALLYDKIKNENKVQQRLNAVQGNSISVSGRKLQVSSNETAKRRKTLENTLKDVENRNKNKTQFTHNPPLKILLRQSGISLSFEQFLLVSVISALLFIGLAFVFLGGDLSLQSIVTMCGLGLIGGLGLPRWIVSFRRNRRIKQFIAEFPNSIDIIVRAVKSGLPLNDGVRLISVEAKQPVKSEFARVVDSQSMGLSIPEAISKISENIPCSEVVFFSIVIQIQSQAGGNLGEALGNLSRVMRDRKKMKGKVQALSMEAKASAAIIGSLPFILTLLIYVSSPNYIMTLFTTSTGNLMLGGSMVWMTIGVLIMKKMINFDM
jgi:tight adherence protein B